MTDAGDISKKERGEQAQAEEYKEKRGETVLHSVGGCYKGERHREIETGRKC